jgi:hypothetical protein
MMIKELCNYCILFHPHLELYSNTSLWIIQQYVTVNYTAIRHCELYSNMSLWIIQQYVTVNYTAICHCEFRLLYSDVMKVTDSNWSCKVSTVTMLVAGQSRNCCFNSWHRHRSAHPLSHLGCLQGLSIHGMKLTTHLSLVLSQRMHGAIPQSPCLTGCTWTTFQAP